MIHVDFCPNGGVTQADSLVSVTTFNEAVTVVRARFPHAVFAVGWDLTGHDLENRWYLATLRVWPHSQGMELDEFGDNLAALMVNEQEKPPFPGARIFMDLIDLVDESDCPHHDSEER